MIDKIIHSHALILYRIWFFYYFQRSTPTDAANLMQIYLWLPEWFVFKPDLSGIKEHLLVLTAQVILHGKHMDPGDQLMSTFLQRLEIEDIISIIDNFAEVE